MSIGHRDTLRALTAYGLSGSLTRLPEGSLDDDAWTVLVTHAVREGLQGQLAWAAANGDLHVTAAQREHAVDLHDTAMAACLRLEGLLLEALGALRSADVPVRVLKGSALAHTAYGDASLRVFRDIDLLVRAEDRHGVIAALRRVGLRILVPTGHGDDYSPSRMAILRRTDGLTVDLHTKIAPSRFGSSLTTDVLFDSDTRYLLSGREVPILTPEQQLIHACFGALSGPRPRWVSLRDIAQLILNTEMDHKSALDEARRGATTPAVARAIRLTWREFELADRVPLSEWSMRDDTDGDAQRLSATSGAVAGRPNDRTGWWGTLRRLGRATLTTGVRKR